MMYPFYSITISITTERHTDLWTQCPCYKLFLPLRTLPTISISDTMPYNLSMNHAYSDDYIQHLLVHVLVWHNLKRGGSGGYMVSMLGGAWRLRVKSSITDRVSCQIRCCSGVSHLQADNFQPSLSG